MSRKENEMNPIPADPGKPDAPTGSRPSYARQALFIALPVLLIFACAELGARLRERYIPPMPVDVGQGFNPDDRLFVPGAGGMMETNPQKSTSFQHQRFALVKPRDTLRIIALGGSSVNYLDYEFEQMKQDLALALSDRYKDVEIINCGGLSYGSHRLVLIASEIIGYAPDVVLLYTGHNEFEELEQMHLATLSDTKIQRMLTISAFYRFIRDKTAQQRIKNLEQSRAIRDLSASIPDSSRTWLHRFSEDEIRTRMADFEKNLETMIQLCQDNQVPVIIGTVPSKWYRPNLPGTDGERYEAVTSLFEKGQVDEGIKLGRALLREATPRHQSSDLENEIIRAVAHRWALPLADVEAAIIDAEPRGIPGETLFNDHCHLNPAGNEILRRLYQQEILNLVQS
ncbi:MAG: SGNH/GDSL hydrolase family protein [Candidatus Hydrogenedentes bacterium]|nr:SGNH/GDSL hydrolase family protein [Candidatus Hydrogenedentota bacterium]